MTGILMAIFIAGSLYFSMEGVIYGTYAILFVLGFNVISITYSSIIFLGLYKYMIRSKKTFFQTDLPANKDFILIRFMLIICVYHIYTLGYIFFAGVALVTAVIALFSYIIYMLDEVIHDET